MSDQAPYVYLVFGIPGSGRRDVIFDLIKDGIAGEEQVLYFRPEDEAASPFDEQIEELDTVHIVNWQLRGAGVKHDRINAAPEKIIFLAPGTCDPADAAEALKTWSDQNQCRIARIITVVHSAFLSENSAAQAWFDACIHFSDVILMNRRENVNNKWIKDFETGYRKQFYPARFLLVKKGRVSNPLEILEPEARRASLYFDELIPIEDDAFEDGEQPEDTRSDKYIERLESGQRAYPVPCIRKLL
jgi:hypothetical protein